MSPMYTLPSGPTTAPPDMVFPTLVFQKREPSTPDMLYIHLSPAPKNRASRKLDVAATVGDPVMAPPAEKDHSKAPEVPPTPYTPPKSEPTNTVPVAPMVGAVAVPPSGREKVARIVGGSCPGPLDPDLAVLSESPPV